MLMVIKVADGTAVVCEEHEVAKVIKAWLPDNLETEALELREAAERLQFAFMRRENTREAEFRLGVIIRP